MTWTSVSPIGSISVKANRTTMAGNTTYIQNTMGNSAAGTNTASTKDHFWNVSSNLDGHHRFVRSPKFEAPAGTAADPLIGTGMDGVQYIRLVNSAVGRVECFYRNSQGIYQTSPSYITGTFVSSSTYQPLTATPIGINCYGDVTLIGTIAGKEWVQTGSFMSDATKVYAFANLIKVRNPDIIAAANIFLDFANGSDASGLFIRAKNGVLGSNTTWRFYITYRATL